MGNIELVDLCLQAGTFCAGGNVGVNLSKDDERYYQSHKCEIQDKCLDMSELKDEQYKWHKVADGDLPKVNCYVLALINDGYKGFPMYYEVMNYDDGAFFRYGIEQYSVVAWMELPKYEEE